MKDTKVDLYFYDKKGKIHTGFCPFLSYKNLVFCILLGYGIFLQSLSAQAQLYVANDSALIPASVVFTGQLPEQEKDTLEQPKKKEKKYIKPGWVALMSAVVPGSGQVVNGQAWKAPVFYAGMAGVGYFVYTNNQYYEDLRAAYKQRKAGEIDKYSSQSPEKVRKFSDQALLKEREFVKRNRDLLVILFTAVYAANILDAYVYAHFRTFDVSDDLSLQVNPTNLINIAGQNYYAASITLKFK
jgi:hypothetical protein